MTVVDKLRLVLLEPVILLYMVSIWMQFNLFQPLLFQKICVRIFANESFCNALYANTTDTEFQKEKDDIQQKASNLMFYSNLCLNIPSLLVAPFLGIWGDQFGRKLAAVIPSVGAFLSAVNYAFCSGYSSAPEELLLLSNLFQGLTGGFTGCILAVSSWASCISSKRVRTSRLGLIEFANLIGTSIAPAIGGAIAHSGYGGYSVAFGFAGFLNIIQVLYVVFFLRVPELDAPAERGTANICRRLWSTAFIRDMLSLMRWIYNDIRARRIIAVAATCLSFTWIVSTGTNEIRYLFIRILHLDWNVLEYNLFAAEDALIRGLTLVTVLPVLKQLLHVRDFTVILLGFASKICMFAFFAASISTVMIFLAPLAGFMAATVSACGRSVCSKAVQKNDQGKLFGLLGLLENLSSLVGSLIFQNVYSATRPWFPGFAYALAGGLLIIPASVTIYFFRRLREDEISNPEYDNFVSEDHFDEPEFNESEELGWRTASSGSVTV